MGLQQTLQKLQNHFKSKRRIQRPKPQRSRQLTLELLEDRTLPTVIFAPRFGAETLLPTPFGNFTYQPLISPDVYLIFWGSYWGTNAAQVNTLKSDAQTIVNGHYTSGLTDYGSAGQAFYAGTFVDSSSDPPAGFNPGDASNSAGAIQTEIAKTINNPASGIPAPPSDGDAIYAVVTALGTGRSYNLPGTYTLSDGFAIPMEMISLSFVPNNTQGAALVFSHELIEGMSDPNSFGVSVAPPSRLPANLDHGGQICDEEPEAYTYRLGGSTGVPVAPYWFNAKSSTGVFILGQGSFVVPDGNSQQVTLRGNWTIDSSGNASFNGNYNLIIGPVDGTITLNETFSGLQITINGQSFFFDPFLDSIVGITVNLGNGNDTVNVDGTLSSDPVTINLGSGTDTVNISPTFGFLGRIQGNVTINPGAFGSATLNVDDQNTVGAVTWTLTSSTVSDQLSATITYFDMTHVNVNGGSGNNTYNIRGTEAVFTTNLNAGTGSDTINVQATGFASTLFVNDASGIDTVNIGSKAPSLGGTLANIAGAVNVSNTSGHTTLNVDDSGDTIGRTITVTNSSITGTWAPAAINYTGGQVTALNLLGGSGGNVFNVVSTAANTTTSINVNHTSIFTSNNRVNIGSLAPSVGGTLANIAGPVNVSSSSGTTVLVLDDLGDTTARTVTLTKSTITGTWSAGAVNYGTVSFLTLLGGKGGNTFDVPSIGTNTTIDGGPGNNTFDVGYNGGSPGIVKNITSSLTINGGAGSNSLTLDDSGNTTTTDTVNLSSTSAGGSRFFGSGGSVTYTGIKFVTLQSSNASFTDSHGVVHGDTITVTPQRGVLFTINGNNPTVAPGDSLTVSLVNGPVTIHPQVPGSGFFSFTGSLFAIVRYTGIETLSPAGWLVTAPDAGHSPEIKVFNAQSGELKFDFLAFDASFRSGVRVAVGDVNGDGIPDIIAAQGPSDGSSGDSLVHSYDGITGQPLAGPLGSFDPFPGFHGGLYVASADLNGDGYADVVVAEDTGGQPRIRVFSGKDGNLLDDFLAFDSSFSGGVRVAAADVNHDGTADIVAAAGPGSAPLVEVFEGTDLAQGVTTPRLSFDAYAPSFTGGVYVATGDVHGDGIPKILTGAGAGGEPRVNVFDGITGDELQSFLAFDPSFRGGVRVAAADVNGDGRSDIVAAQGPGGVPRVRGFDGLSLQQIDEFFAFHPNFRDGVFVAGGGRWGLFHSLDGHAESGDALPRIVVGQGAGSQSVLSAFDGSTKDQPQNLEAFQPGFHGEVRVAAPDVNGDGRSDLIATEGAGGLPRVRGWDGLSLEQIDEFFAFDPNFRDGVFVAGGGRWR